MNKIFKTIGLLSLICFSFFYTDKVMLVINEQDSMMIKLVEIQDNYKKEAVNAIINDNTIVPGINGKKVNIDKSYNRMKKVGIFNSSLLVYDELLPDISLNNNYDKYIIKANNMRKQVSLIFMLNKESSNNLDNLITILKQTNTASNIFIDYNYIVSNLSKIKLIKDYELYSYNHYTNDKFMYTNNIIQKLTKQKISYCLTQIENKDILSICKKNKINTIIPNIIALDNPYNNIKATLTNGSIILLNIDTKTINELPNIIDFINSKGLEIVFLSNLLTEKTT